MSTTLSASSNRQRKDDDEDDDDDDLQITITDAIQPSHKKNEQQMAIVWWMRLIRKPQSEVDPRDWPQTKKYIIVLIVALSAFTAPCASAIYFPAIEDMQNHFGTTDTIMNASLSVYVFCLALFPLVWATFGDEFGRRPIYIASFLIAVVGMICCAVSVNAAMFIVFRAVSAVGTSSVLSAGAGTIGDIFNAHERGTAFAVYQIGPLAGPALGPIFGGFLNAAFGWQSIFWFLALLCFVLWVAILLLLPETRYTASATSAPCPDDSARKAVPGEHTTKVQHRVMNPVAALNFMRYANITLTVLFLGILFFVYYVLSSNFTRIYTNQYGFTSGTVGLFYLPLAGGFIIGSLVGGRYSDHIYASRVAKLTEAAAAAGKSPHPELRIGGFLLYACMVMLLLAYIAFGWCMQKNVHYAFGLVCTGIIGFCLGPPNTILPAYIIDCFREHGASVIACNNFVRYLLAGIGTLVSSEMAIAMGTGILYTFCGALLFVSSSAFIVVKLKGESWRQMQQQRASRQQMI